MNIGIAVRYKGVTCILVGTPIRCCTSGFQGPCGANGGSWCREGLCSSFYGASLEKLFGHPVKWEHVKDDPGNARVVVLVEGALYELIATPSDYQSCRAHCSLHGSSFCEKYCAHMSNSALCKELNKFLDTKGSYFKKVKG